MRDSIIVILIFFTILNTTDAANVICKINVVKDATNEKLKTANVECEQDNPKLIVKETVKCT
jgi:hypothetical protein